MTKMKNSMNGSRSRMEWTEYRVSELEDKTTEFTQSGKLRKHILKKSMRNLCQYNKISNIHVLRILDEDKDSGLKIFQEIMAANYHIYSKT